MAAVDRTAVVAAKSLRSRISPGHLAWRQRLPTANGLSSLSAAVVVGGVAPEARAADVAAGLAALAVAVDHTGPVAVAVDRTDPVAVAVDRTDPVAVAVDHRDLVLRANSGAHR